MIYAFIKLQFALLHSWLICGLYSTEIIVNPGHSHYRRYTQKYRRKQGIVKSLWILAGLVGLVFPLLHILVFIGLFSTFLSFMILDETP